MRVTSLPLAFSITVAVITSSSLSACTGSGTGYTVAQIGGNYLVLSQHCYADNSDFQAVGNMDADTILNTLNTNTTGPHWTNLGYIHDNPIDLLTDDCSGDPAISASTLVGSLANQSDFIWFSGHGAKDPGDNLAEGVLGLYNYTPGDDCNQIQNSCFSDLSPGLPYSGSTKWIFAVASYDDADFNYIWANAFNQNAQGLHGFYGYEEEPSDNDPDAIALATQFLSETLQSFTSPNPITIHQAWIDAARANQNPSSYGIFELQSASTDQLTATPAGKNWPATGNGIWSSSNPVEFYDANNPPVVFNPDNYTPAIQPLSTVAPGSYQRYSLIPETWSDSSIASAVNQYDPNSAKFYPSSNEYRIQGNVLPYQGSHFEATGALLSEANMSVLPYTYSVSDAYNFAVQELTQYGGGLPSDAVLHDTITHYSRDASGADVISYEFVWRHANGLFGGDRIDVGVDNVRVKHCERYDCGACVLWQTTYPQRVDYMYRLWRAFGSAIGQGGTMLSPIQALQKAETQSTLKGARSDIGTLLGYTYSYWSPQYALTDNTAYPAYNYYYTSHKIVSVDAASGNVLGISGTY